jgi:hypothetical protein
MIFLVQYDRSQGVIQRFDQYSDAEEATAEAVRFEIELGLSRSGSNAEVLLLEASDENALRRTHRRYFESISSISANPTVSTRARE